MPLRLIRKAIRGWEAYQCRKRHSRLLMSSKAYAAAHEAVQRDRRAHKRTRTDLKSLRDALHAELRREVRL